MAPHPPVDPDVEVFAPYEVIGELGARPIPVHVARQVSIGAPTQLVVAERFPGANRAGDASGSDLRREARRISTLANPHIARVREVALRGDDLVVFGDFIDGEKLREFWSFAEGAERLPLEIALRVLLDVMTGAGALHTLRDATQQPMKLVHGELSPSTLLFGSDGVARILHSVARRAPGAPAEDASLPYLAPEVHSWDAHDARADIFSLGVLLWEVLEGRHLTADGEEPAGVRVRSGPLPAPSFPDKAPWAKGLVPVAVKALAAAPEDRWPTAAAMAAEVRKAAGLKLAAASAASAFAKTRFGDRVKQRRAKWEGTAAAPPPAFEVQRARSEQFSSSLLESVAPPALPQLPPSGEAAAEDMPETVESIPPFEPEIAPLSALIDAPPPTAAPPTVPSSVPEALAVTSEAAPSTQPMGYEAPIAVESEETAASFAAPFASPSPLPALVSDAPPPLPARSRRRSIAFAGAIAVAAGAIAVFAVRAAHHAPVAAASAPPAQAAVMATTEPPVAAPAVAPAPVASTSPAPESSPSASAAANAKTPPSAKAKPPAAKSKAAGVAAPHSKSGTVRAQGHGKP